ncbi:hypothetical protein NP493_870g02027 [Ridgeia piscesae]|uniref:Nucleosome assembly protein 1-like 4 n=1 Tax=Ridgeia piscesae TaxID=27915 RepID=A0AAD9KL83_RIDPI|nr:hypothetical protein NP493_870g02027 [Ridgeia piscesae]
MADTESKPENVEEDIEEISTEQQGQGDATSNQTTFQAPQITSLMQNPEVLAALQDRLGSMIGSPSGYIQSLPKVVKRRIKALKKLQFEMIKIESTFYEEVHALECKYATKYTPLVEKRQEIVTGNIEPTDSDCDWPSDDEEGEDEKLAESPGKIPKIEDDMKTKAKVEEVNETGEKTEEKAEGEKTEGEDGEEDKKEEDPVGISEFWLTIFKNIDMLSDMVQEQDEPILKHLRDIRVKLSQSDPMGFTLEFYFDENEFFTNTMLSKEYIMRSEPDKDEPFGFEGPEIVKCKGCTIDWKKGKNVTVKVIKKMQKHKGRGTKRTVTKTVQNDSFFNFFGPPTVPDGEEPDEETEALLAADFEIGHFIRERIVPRAVLYFTGEALDDDYDDEEGEEEEVSSLHTLPSLSP